MSRIIELPENKKPIGCQWTNKIKYNNNENFDHYKARLVAKGYIQTVSIDFQKTFAHAAKMTAIRVIFSLVVQQQWSLYQMDVKNTFLYGDLEEKIYVMVPLGMIVKGFKNPVCRLKKICMD